jgi:DNA-binding NarL/FixJ family response regulator
MQKQSSNHPIRVVLADDHRLLREGLRAMIQSEPDMELVGEAEEGRQAVQLAEELSPDVVVMDISMPGLNGMDATRQIRTRNPRVKVVALSAHTDQRMTSGMISAGASGYLPKHMAFEELASAIRTVAADEVYLSPQIAGGLLEQLSGNTATAATNGLSRPLSPREREVLQLMAEGKATKEVAAVLHVSVKTVETHRRQMMEKLKLYSVAELTKYALREGLTTIDT